MLLLLFVVDADDLDDRDDDADAAIYGECREETRLGPAAPLMSPSEAQFPALLNFEIAHLLKESSSLHEKKARTLDRWTLTPLPYLSGHAGTPW